MTGRGHPPSPCISRRMPASLRLVATPRVAGDSEDENLSDLSDVEVSQYLLSAEESQMKETVWTQMNQEYLDAQAIKGAQQAAAAEVCCPPTGAA